MRVEVVKKSKNCPPYFPAILFHIYILPWKIVDALLYLKSISSDNKVILNSSSTFSGNLDRNIIDFMNDEEELSK